MQQQEYTCKRKEEEMTAFPCYDNTASTLWTFSNGECDIRDRKVLLKSKKLLCYSERYTALMTVDFDDYWASSIETKGRVLEFTPVKTKTAVEKVFLLKGEALERDFKKIEDYVPGVSWIKSLKLPERFNDSTQSEFRAMCKDIFEQKVTTDRLYFIQRLRRQVTDIFRTPLYYWVHGDSFDIYYFRRVKTEKGFERYIP